VSTATLTYKPPGEIVSRLLFGRTPHEYVFVISLVSLFAAGPAFGQAAPDATDDGVDEQASIARTSTESIVDGETVDRLPLDDAADIVVLQPGVVETTRGRALRGGRPGDEAVLIDGVLTRSFGRGVAENVAIPTNALEQVGVNVGAFPAAFGEARSGIVNYVTRSGGSELSGSFEAMSDQLGPDAWRTNFNRVELTLGGAIAGPLHFFVAGTAEGQDATVTENAPRRFVISGADTCDIVNFCETANGGPGLGAPATFALPRTSATPGLDDSVAVVAPNFVAWNNGRTAPFGWSERDAWHLNVNWRLPRESRVGFSFTRNRHQGAGHPGFTTNLLFDGVDGALSTRNVYALSWLQTLRQTADERLALDILAAFSQDRDTNGMLDQVWWRDNADPSLGFLSGNADFAYDGERSATGFDLFDPSEAFVNAYRSNGIPRDSLLLLLPNRLNLTRLSQSAAGLSSNLRANPYALSSRFPIDGAGTEGFTRHAENRLQLRGALDWQPGRTHRIRAGVEYFAIALDAFNRPLTSGVPVPEAADPRKLALFLQDRLSIDDLVVEAGLRYDRLDPDIEYPRTPGYVFNVPDSLKLGFVRYDAESGSYVPLFDEPCGGVSPSNPNGTCLANFIAAETKSELSPRLGISFAVSDRSTFRASYGRFVQTPAFFTAAPITTGGVRTFADSPGLLQNVNFDLQNGNLGTTFGRDVELPVTRKFELGYRLLLGEDLVIDVAAFDEEQTGALTTSAAQFEDPNSGTAVFLKILANGEAVTTQGFQVSLDQSFGRLIDSRLSYTFVDPDRVFSIAQSRRHNLNWTGGLTFPSDYRSGSIVGAILRDVGLFTVLRVRSGLRYSILENAATGLIGPPSPSASLALDAGDAPSTPWTTAFDLRLTKAFRVSDGLALQAFVDWRNPFDIENSSAVFLETGDVVNGFFRASQLAPYLRDTQLDGSNDVDDFDIRAESRENSFNTFMLLRAEERFGDGDGVFSVAEQEAAFGQFYENEFGADTRFRTSDQLMRLGVRLTF
jgi:hypothetical protein